MDLITRHQPVNQEDWKALYWLAVWGGEKPSNVERVHIKVQDGFCYIWHDERLTTEAK